MVALRLALHAREPFRIASSQRKTTGSALPLCLHCDHFGQTGTGDVSCMVHTTVDST